MSAIGFVGEADSRGPTFDSTRCFQPAALIRLLQRVHLLGDVEDRLGVLIVLEADAVEAGDAVAAQHRIQHLAVERDRRRRRALRRKAAKRISDTRRIVILLRLDRTRSGKQSTSRQQPAQHDAASSQSSLLVQTRFVTESSDPPILSAGLLRRTGRKVSFLRPHVISPASPPADRWSGSCHPA